MSVKKTTDPLKSEVSKSRPRGEKGDFISTPDFQNLKSPLDKFLASHTGNYKDEEDLLDIRIGNPLRRVIGLLEEIKKQKAFSFTLKGSLGIAGVVLALSFFGIFGGGQVICDKGTQSIIGTVRELNFKEIYVRQIPVLSYVLDFISPPIKQIKNRTILISSDDHTIYLPYSENIFITPYLNNQVIVTGSFNSCTDTLTINDSSGIEYYIK